MFTETKCISVVCDNCKECLIDSRSEFSLFVDSNSAEDAISDNNWACIDEKHYCHNCVLMDEECKISLLKLPPIYQVIEDYPGNSDFKKGEILHFESGDVNDILWEHVKKGFLTDRQFTPAFFNKYPHIFRKIR